MRQLSLLEVPRSDTTFPFPLDSGGGLPALTLWQPWASFVEVGAKRIETRSWPVPESLVGGWLAIHAARTWNSVAEEFVLSLPRQFPGCDFLRKAGYLRWNELPKGEIVAVVRVAEGVRLCETGLLGRPPLPDAELLLGDYRRGRWGWVFDRIFRVYPGISVRGKQGIWRWSVPQELKGSLSASELELG